MDSGDELELGPGGAHVVGSGHDAWVEGDEPCVTIDFEGSLQEGTPAATGPCGVSNGSWLLRIPAPGDQERTTSDGQHDEQDDDDKDQREDCGPSRRLHGGTA